MLPFTLFIKSEETFANTKEKNSSYLQSNYSILIGWYVNASPASTNHITISGRKFFLKLIMSHHILVLYSSNFDIFWNIPILKPPATSDK